MAIARPPKQVRPKIYKSARHCVLGRSDTSVYAAERRGTSGNEFGKIPDHYILLVFGCCNNLHL